MTKEEAYNRIDAIIAIHEIDDMYVTITSILDYDALRIARKALEQEPKTDNDLDIKLKLMEANINGYTQGLKDASNTEQEPKSGHWKRISMDKYSEHAKYWFRCDRCGKDNLGNTDWCPNCGARMIEEQEVRDKE